MYLVSVYGTLKSGLGNHGYLIGSKFIKEDHTGDGYALFVDKRSELPFVERDKDGKGCEIEIYEVDQSMLEELDRLEGHPHFYRREVLKKLDDREVWIYIYNQDSKYFKKQNIEKAISSFNK